MNSRQNVFEYDCDRFFLFAQQESTQVYFKHAAHQQSSQDDCPFPGALTQVSLTLEVST